MYTVPPRREARRRRPSRLAVAGGVLAALWLLGGLAGAARYLDSYYEYRGFEPLTHPAGVSTGRTVSEHFYSAALGREASYLVYLPPQYDAPGAQARRFPVLYLLHGTPGQPQNFLKIAGMGVELDILLNEHRVSPMLMVMPDGRIGGNLFSDSEWANGDRGRYASFVLDVVNDVDIRLRTKPIRTKRVIAGYSEGGFGATNLALRHPNVFAGLESWSGYYVENHAGTFGGASPATLAANSPLDYAASLAPVLARFPLRGFFYTGLSDPEGDQLAPLVTELRAAGAQAQFARYPGGHDWGLWHAHAQLMIEIANHYLQVGPRRVRIPGSVSVSRALAEGRTAAALALIGERRRLVFHHRHVLSCQAVVSRIQASDAADLAPMSAVGRSLVFTHLVYDCLGAGPSLSPSAALCPRLPLVLALVNRSILARRRAITLACLLQPVAPPLPARPPRRSRLRRG